MAHKMTRYTDGLVDINATLVAIVTRLVHYKQCNQTLLSAVIRLRKSNFASVSDGLSEFL